MNKYLEKIALNRYERHIWEKGVNGLPKGQFGTNASKEEAFSRMVRKSKGSSIDADIIDAMGGSAESVKKHRDEAARLLREARRARNAKKIPKGVRYSTSPLRDILAKHKKVAIPALAISTGLIGAGVYSASHN